MSKIIESVELRYQEGNSDKVYKAAIESAGDGHVVNFAYGRRGSALNSGTKTQSPVSLEEALKVYNKLVKAKTAKGYRVFAGTDSDTAISVANNAGEDTGLRPQLLNAIDDDTAEAYINHPDWCAQEKHDGRRILIRKSNDTVTAANRRGLAVACSESVIEALEPVQSDFVIDGELVGDKFHCFDMLENREADMRCLPYSQRLAMLEAFFGALKCDSFSVVKTSYGDAKVWYVDLLRVLGCEGAVFKHLTQPWYAGRPSSGGSALKLKFWQTCSCVVCGINKQRSVQLSLDDHSIGNVTIPPNHDIPEVGDVVEIRYLYVNGPNGKLYQPIYLGVRDDILPGECTLEIQQLKYKAAA